MNRDVTFGQFIPGNSILHRMDPRVKIVLLCTIIATIFCTFNFYALGLITAFIIVAILLSGVPFKMYLKSLKVIMIIVIITSLLNIFYSSGTPIFEFWIFKITLDGIFRAIYVTVRIIALILISSALTFTTSPTDLTDAIERLMSPLKVFHIKVHEIAMMMTIALRFIPTLLDETDKIMSAQKSRGADMESGGIFKRVKAVVPVMIPLFVSSFRRANELEYAMECRCYRGGAGRTKMKIMKMSAKDYVLLILSIIYFVGIVLARIFMSKVI